MIESTPPSDDLSTGLSHFFPAHTECLMFYSVPTQSPSVPHDEQQIARNVQALKNRLRGRGGRRGGRATGGGKESLPNSE